ncbi:MAG: ligase-associated DNA damage response exonuclease [Saprospiraceae bacterium]|nr:ligase-associated DNA damage response exonuclease [Saprospiraceae bacterium]
MPLLTFKKGGIYCAQADVYIDPWSKVDRAIITHAHSDHARWGHQHYLCTSNCEAPLKHRLGNISVQSMPFREEVVMNGVRISFHPAGHIIGSAQVRVEYQGEVWVVSGDYKLVDDGFATPFESVKCHHFVTESTFGLPVYTWADQQQIFDEINTWWAANRANGKVSIIAAYSLGKAQRLIQNVDHSIGPVFTHGAVENMNAALRAAHHDIQPTIQVTKELDKKSYKGGLVIAPGSALGSSWVNKFKPFSLAYASGWMALRGTRRRRAADRGFALSDHADWDGLNTAIAATGAENIYVTHGYSTLFSNWLKEQGLNAAPVETQYVGESIDVAEEEVAI